MVVGLRSGRRLDGALCRGKNNLNASNQHLINELPAVYSDFNNDKFQEKKDKLYDIKKKIVKRLNK